MSTTAASPELILLNKKRRELLKSCRKARLQQRDYLRKVAQVIHSQYGVEDQAETYFTLEGEYGGKTFLQRLQASMRAMVRFYYNIPMSLCLQM